MSARSLNGVHAATAVLLGVQLERRDDARAALARLRVLAAEGGPLEADVEGLPAVPPPSLVDEHLEELRELRAEGLTFAAIGERFGVSRQAVQSALRGGDDEGSST